ncbi:hypothetical protein [Parvimonas sp. C2]|jgi:hypothetical protein|uniref:hypothetical protein n=1 Tax=Parvimonas sp. C2 TaxID=3110692 RepID=UPI002B45B024|nr:hypothetical protein [Parvimonas sp. C2]MEB3072572.1 hypothetical protein [Parvimonas sp. C2]
MKNNKLYSIFFPAWIVLLFPLTWIIALPLDLLRQSFVLCITLKFLNTYDIIEKAGKVIRKVFLYGILANIVGIICLFFITIMVGIGADMSGIVGWISNNVVEGLMTTAFYSIYAFIVITIPVVISGFCIYKLNLNYSFKNLDLDIKDKKKLALSLAVFTAPYLFYCPSIIYILTR